MDAVTSEEAMRREVIPLMGGALAREYGWTFEIAGLVVYVTLCPRRVKDRKFLLRVSFDEYSKLAPSYGFANPESRQVDVAAAPPNVLHPTGGICCPGTREFHEGLHRGDVAHPWDPSRYTVANTIQNIQRLMERGVSA